ncbi:hypothetical protein B0H17DRAFT_842630, partial [Mycena rosella]
SNTKETTGKIAVITGSSRSIGAAIARHMGEQGAKVVVNYVNDSKAADEVVSAIKATSGSAVAVKADASTIAGGQHLIDETIKAFGGIDILVLNAGFMGTGILADVDEASYDAHFATNVKGPLFLAKAAASLLPTRKYISLELDPGGRIIFFSSSLTASSGMSIPCELNTFHRTDFTSSVVAPNTLVYTATKGAIEQIGRILAKDLGAKGITVNTVSPGPVDTPLFRQGKPQHVIDTIAKLAPSSRLGEVEDIAPVVSFLASPAAQWVNGQNIRVNG